MYRTVTRFFPVSGLLLLAAASAAAVSLDAIPTPRPAGWSVDLTGTLRHEDLRALDRLGDAVEAQTGAELAVVVVGSTDGVPHRQFATALANHWGIGDPQKNNGVLVFAALDDRAAEIILGEGIDGAQQVTIALEIMQGEMVPRFRAGNPAEAIRAGAFACASRILGAGSTIAEGAPGASATSPPEQNLRSGMAPLAGRPALGGENAPRLATSRGRLPGGVLWAALLGGGGIVGVLGLLGGGAYYYSRRPRRCRRCQTEMVRLGEAEDDAHLTSGEQAEEKLGSVDYELFACPACGEAEKLRHRRFFSSYANCPRCGARTVGSSSWTEVAATTSHEGRVRVDETCRHCDYRSSYTRSVARRPQPSSSRSSWSGSSSRSSSGFGGGRSSGGGASGRW